MLSYVKVSPFSELKSLVHWNRRYTLHINIYKSYEKNFTVSNIILDCTGLWRITNTRKNIISVGSRIAQ